VAGYKACTSHPLATIPHFPQLSLPSQRKSVPIFNKKATAIASHSASKATSFCLPKHPPPTPHMDQKMTIQMSKDLETLRVSFEEHSWHRGTEPVIGSQDCPILAENYGERGRSCYIIFVYQKADLSYGCRHELCFRDGDDRGPSFDSPELAIEHQRQHHF
jgi:hypothetical protein